MELVPHLSRATSPCQVRNSTIKFAPPIFCLILRHSYFTADCARLARIETPARSRKDAKASGSDEKCGNGSTPEHDPRCGTHCRRRRRNNFSRAEFQLSGKQGNPRPRQRSHPPPWVSAQRAGAPNSEAPLGNCLLSSEQPRFFASFSCPHSARRRILCNHAEAPRALCRAALFAANDSRENRFASRSSGAWAD